MFENKTVRTLFYLTIGLLLWAYFAGLFIDVTRDAGKYATVAKEIFQNGNYINLTVHGEPYDQKPPLLFWLGALGFAVGGISNFWFKLPVLLVVFFGLYSAFRLGKTLHNKRVGYLTLFLLAFSFIYPFYSMDIHTDTPMQAFITFALWQLADFIKTKRTRSWILGFTGIGLAMLCKGPLGAAIPAFAILGHLLLKKEFKAFADYRWYAGVLLAFVVVSPALIGLVNQFGWDGIEFFFWENNVGRLTGTYVKPNSDPVFYVHNLLYLFLPWSILFYISAFFEFKTLFKNKFRAPEYFTFTGIWIFFIILNASKSQLPNYIFGIMPLIALLTARWIDIAARQKSLLQKIFLSTQNIVTILLWIITLTISGYLFPRPGMWFWLVFAAGITFTVIVLVNTEKPLVKIIFPPAMAIAVFFILLNMHVFPYIFSFQAPPKAARYFTDYAAPTDTLYNYNYGKYELFFYSEPQAIQLYSDEEMKNVAGKNGTWIFTDAEGYEKIREMDLAKNSAQILKYQHLNLNRGGKFINPKTRREVLIPMYLIKY
jgi:hypothetical protein